MSSLPRLIVLLLRMRVPEAWLEFVLGDLEEGMIQRGGSSREARRWAWWQAIRIVVRPPRDRAATRVRVRPDFRHFHGALGDLRYACRGLARSRWYTATAVGVVALSTSLGTAVFAMVDGVLFDEPPYARPAELYVLNGGFHKLPDLVMPSVSTPDVTAWSAVAGPALSVTRMRLGGGVPISDNEYLRSGEIDDRFFDVLGIRPLFGGFEDGDFHDAGRVRPALITWRVWHQRFHADPRVIGRTLMDSKGSGLRVSGVLAEDFVYPHPAGVVAPEMLVPIRPPSPAAAQNPQVRWLHVVGRLSPGTSLADLVPRLDAAAARVASTFPPVDSTEPLSPARQITRGPFDRVIVRPLGAVLTESTRSVAGAVFGAFGALLLLASLNLAGLAAGRALDRRRELALRRALGATGRRVVRLLLVEHALVIFAGAVLGVAAARPLLDLSMSLAPDGLMLLKSPAIDVRAIVFTVIAAAVSLLTTTCWSARASTSVTERSALSEGGATTERGRSRVRMVLISGQIAAALVLVIIGVLFSASLMRAWAEDTGFSRSNTARLRVHPGSSFGVPAITELLDAIEAMPGVIAAGGLNEPFLERAITGSAFDAPAGALPLDADVENLAVTSGFFGAAGLRLIQGRLPTRAEFDGGQPVVVVSRTVAEAYWPHEPALGKVLRKRKQAYEVIAVVDDARYRALDAEPGGEIYSSIADQPGLANVIVALDGNASRRLAEIVTMIGTRFPRVRVARAETMDQALSASIQRRRFHTWLFAGLGGAGLAIAAVGIVGLVGMSTSQRTREVGVRMALGATRRRVVQQMLTEQLWPLAIGLVSGGILAGWALRFLQEYAYKLSIYDPGIWMAAMLVIAGAAAIGSLAPVIRATRVDPVSALRAE